MRPCGKRRIHPASSADVSGADGWELQFLLLPQAKSVRMSRLQDHYHRNQLLMRMPPEDFALLEPHMRVVQHELRDELMKPDTPLTHVYFPETAVTSVLKPMATLKPEWSARKASSEPCWSL